MREKNDENIMERMMKEVVKSLLTLLVFFVIFILIVVPLLKDKFGIMLFSAPENCTDEVQIADVPLDVQYLDDVGYVVCIKSTIQNKSDALMRDVAVEFDLIDAGGTVIDNAVGTIEMLDAGGMAEFTATTTAPLEVEAKSYRLRRVVALR